MTCTCYNFYEYFGLCAHVITACRFEVIDLYTYFHFVYLVKSYHKTYYTLIKPIFIKDLTLDSDLYLPKLYKLYGRPKTKRVKKIAWNRQVKKCKNYRQLGYNTRRCTNLLVAKNGYRERAFD